MPRQDNSIEMTQQQRDISDLEKKYFGLIEEIITDEDGFLHDLLLMEKEVQNNYNRYGEAWDKKNKVNISVQRLMWHYIYTRMQNIIGIYPSPLSPDLGIRLDDVTLGIDLKTIDTHGNRGDLRETHMEENQTSFDNSNYDRIPSYSMLAPIDTYNNQNKPVLSYIVKIVYHDTGNSFNFERRDAFPGMVLVCIPNGKLSNLFGNNIIANYKTYAYYNETDGEYYRPKRFRISDIDGGEQDMITKCTQLGFQLLPRDQYNKLAFFDPATEKIRRKTSMNNVKVLGCVKYGSSVRYKNEYMTYRYDGDGNPWTGYKTYSLPDPLPAN